MAQQVIDVTEPDADTLPSAGAKINENFTELYTDKAPLESPALTGTPTAPTAAGGTSTTQIATTEFVEARITTLIGTAAANLDTLGEISDALNDDANLAATLTTSIAGKQPLDADLTAIAGLTPSVDDILQFKGTAWANRTMAQVKADLLAVASAWTFAGAAANTNAVTINGTGLGSNAALIISSESPCMTWDDTNAGTNARRWNARATGLNLIFEAINNADAGQKQFLNVARGNASSDITAMIYGNSTDLPTHSFRGEIIAGVAGKGISVKEGSNARMGVADLVAGAVTVANTSVTANTRVVAFSQSDGGTPGWLRCSARAAGTSFTITSSSALDTSTIVWLLFEPAP